MSYQQLNSACVRMKRIKQINKKKKDMCNKSLFNLKF